MVLLDRKGAICYNNNMPNNKQKLVRDSFGRFMSTKRVNIVNGRLYALDGTVTVRARMKCQNGYYMVSYHKDLFGIVNPSRLGKISTARVGSYLKRS